MTVVAPVEPICAVVVVLTSLIAMPTEAPNTLADAAPASVVSASASLDCTSTP